MTSEKNRDQAKAPMKMWGVSFNATDYPDKYAARLFEVYPNEVKATETVVVSADYAVIERQMAELGLYKLPRSASDPPHIIESWV